MTRLREFVLLSFLAAIWGGSFVFMRNSAPALGPVWLPLLRCGIAGLALAAYLEWTGRRLQWRRNGFWYAMVGIFGAAIPFPLFAYAAQHLPAAYSAVINATVPLWGALLASLWLREVFTVGKALGLALGLAGVALLVGAGPVAFTREAAWSALGLVLACVSFAGAQVATKRWAPHVDSVELTAGLLLVSSVVLVPIVPWYPLQSEPTGFVWANVFLLALLASGYATARYMRLVVEMGPSRAMSVTFLIPLFAMLWGMLFLGEPVRPSMVLGCVLVLLATALVMYGSRRVTVVVELGQ